MVPIFSWGEILGAIGPAIRVEREFVRQLWRNPATSRVEVPPGAPVQSLEISAPKAKRDASARRLPAQASH